MTHFISFPGQKGCDLSSLSLFLCLSPPEIHHFLSLKRQMSIRNNKPNVPKSIFYFKLQFYNIHKQNKCYVNVMSLPWWYFARMWTKLCLITIVYKIQKAYTTTKQIKYRLLTFPLKSQSFCGNIQCCQCLFSDIFDARKKIFSAFKNVLFPLRIQRVRSRAFVLSRGKKGLR